MRFVTRYGADELPQSTVFDESSEAWTAGPAYALGQAAIADALAPSALAVQIANLIAQRSTFEDFVPPPFTTDGDDRLRQLPWPEVAIVAAPWSWTDGEVMPAQPTGSGVIDDDARQYARVWVEIPPPPFRDEDATPNLFGLPVPDEGWRFATMWPEVPPPPFRDEDTGVGLYGVSEHEEWRAPRFLPDTGQPRILWSDGETIVAQPVGGSVVFEDDRWMPRRMWTVRTVTVAWWTEEIGTVVVVPTLGRGVLMADANALARWAFRKAGPP